MRISTSALHQQALSSILLNQAKLAQTQNQLALSTKLLSASSDPAGWSRAEGLDASLAMVERYRTNASAAQLHLGLEENALTDATEALNRIRELAIQANSASVSADARHSIAEEMRSRLDALLGAANADDGQGRYIFAGSQDGAKPFLLGTLGAQYSGDQNVTSLEIGAQRSIAWSDAGDAVFQKLSTGNGTFVVTTGAANAGGAALKSADVQDATQWDGGTYTLTFNGGNYEVRDASSTLVTSGAYQAGTGIQFRGIRLTIEGTPSDGDTMTVAPSTQQDVFASIQRLISLVDTKSTSATASAQEQTDFIARIQELDAAMAQITKVRGTVGNRLSAVDDALAQSDALEVQNKAALSDVRDLDYAEAAGRLTLQMTALQAAQQSYMKIQSLSLFDFLR